MWFIEDMNLMKIDHGHNRSYKSQLKLKDVVTVVVTVRVTVVVTVVVTVEELYILLSSHSSRSYEKCSFTFTHDILHPAPQRVGHTSRKSLVSTFRQNAS